MGEKAFVTGAAGFIGAALSVRLLEAGHSVVGIDSLTDYYDPQLKLDRLERLHSFQAFRFHQIDVKNTEVLRKIFLQAAPKSV